MAVIFENLSGTLTSSPAVCTWADGRLDVFVRGTDDALYHKWYQGGWSDWEQLGPEAITADPCAVSWGEGRIDVFVRGTDGAVYQKLFDDGRWTGYQRVRPEPIVGSPAACSGGAGQIDLLVRGTDDGLYHIAYDGQWRTYRLLGGSLTSDPAAVALGPGRMDVFVRNAETSLSRIQFRNGTWGPWESFPGAMSSKPAVCGTIDGSLDLFCRDLAGRVVHLDLARGAQSWLDIGTPVNSALACARSSGTRIDLFGRGAGNELVHAWRDADGWQPAAPTAICLSGGGARGDFQLGACEYLYERGIRPGIICGASVGAINGAKLAEGEDPANSAQGLAGLRRIWASLQQNSDMWTEEAWLSDPDMSPKLAEALRGRSPLSVTSPQHFYTWGIFDDLANFISDLAWLTSEGQSLLKAAGVILQKARALYNLNPIAARLNQAHDRPALDRWAAAGGKLRLAVVSLESGRLRYATEDGRLLEKDGSTVPDPTRVPAPCRPAAEKIAALEAEARSIEDERRDLQQELRTAPPGAKARLVAGIRALTQRLAGVSTRLAQARASLEQCRRTQPVEALRVHLPTAILASASIPGIFPPVGLGSENYVDGGIREVIPLQAAVDLGAGEIFALHASSRQLPAFVTPRSAGVLEIVSRSLTEIAIDEVNLSDRITAPARGGVLPRVIHIEPEFNLHDIRVIDPGLIRIARDYGYMTAADALAGSNADPERPRSATVIAEARLAIWKLENRRFGQADPTEPAAPVPAGPDPSLQAEIDGRKTSLRALIGDRRARLRGPMPVGIDEWTRRMELHPWSSGFDGWQSLGGVLTSNPAASLNAPGGLVVFARGSDDAIWHSWQDEINGDWRTWQSLGGNWKGAPAAGLYRDGRLNVFARGVDDAIWTRWQTTTNGEWYPQWESLGGALTGDPAACLNAPGGLVVFARGSDNAVWHTWQDENSGDWRAWQSLGGQWVGAPAAGLYRDGRLNVFARGADGAIWTRWQTTPNGDWYPQWESLGGVLTGDPGVTLNATGGLSVFAVGTDGAVWQTRQNEPSGTWSPWQGVGGSWSGGPAAAIYRDGRMNLFARGADSAIWTRWQTAPDGDWNL